MDNLCGFHSIALYFHLHNQQVSDNHTLNILELRERLILEYKTEVNIDSPIEKVDIKRRIDRLSRDMKEWLSDEDFAMLSKILNVCFYVYREDQGLWQIYSYDIPQMNNFDESNKECNKIVNQNTSNATQRTKIFLNATGIHYDLLLDKNININRIKFNEYSSITKQNQINSEWKNEYNFKSQVQLPDFYDNDNDDDNSSTYSDFFNISLVQNESRDMSQNKKQKKLQKKKEKTPKNNSASSISSNSSSYNYDIFESDDDEYVMRKIDKFNSNVIRQIPEQRRKVPVKTDQQLRKIVQTCFNK